MIKLYNLSGAGLKKLIPASSLFVFVMLLLYVDTAPASVVFAVATIVCGHAWIE
jgi:hypothetical protein